MAQVSYGTITITDTTDIENIFLIYKGSSSDSIAPSINWSSGGTTNDWVADITEVGEYDYIWAITVFKRTGIAITSSNFTDYYSDPICLTGEPGTSVSITSITYSTLTTQGQPADNTFTLTSPPNVPEGGYLWSRTLFSNGQSMYSKAKQGEKGDSVTGVRELYYLTTGNAPSKPTSSTTIYDYDIIAAWTSVVPEYIVNGKYYISLETTLSNNNKDFSNVVLDQGLTDANHNAYLSQSLAQSANENANGAMGQANNGIKEIYRVWYRTNSGTAPNKPSTHVIETNNNLNNTWTKVKPIENSNYCYYFYCEETVTNGGVSSWTDPVLDTTTLSKYEVEALDSRTKTFFFPGDSSYPGAYVVGKDSDDGLDKTDISTYGFNTRVTTTGISIGYNAAKVLHLKTTPSPASLDFYKPPTISGNTVTEGELAASLSATGLILSKGGVKAGTAGQSGFIYLSTENYGSNLTINSHQASNWREIIGTKFGVDADGNLYASNAEISGKITVGSGSNVYTKSEANGAFDASGAASAAQAAAEATAAADATAKANAAQAAAEANASYSVEIQVTSIDYANSSATLVAVPYYQGNTTLPTLPNEANYSYRWYKGATALSNTSTEPTIDGATTATLTLGEGSDLEAIYVCVISKP